MDTTSDETGATRRGRSPAGPGRESTRHRTEQRILDGALEAASRFGIAKLGMGDVSVCAGVSRGTAYRYFPNLDTLLNELGRREAERFERRVYEELERTPAGPERLALVLDFAARLASEHPLLQRLPETDPALVLLSLRQRFPAIRATLHRLLAPLLEETTLVRAGVASSEEIAGLTTRVLVSAFLLPDPDPERMAESLKAVYRMLTVGDGSA